MSERKISYLSRSYEEYKEQLLSLFKKYYPQIDNELDDATIGSFLVDMVSSIADNLSFHIDRVFNETNIDSAKNISSVYALARSNGFKVPGPKGSITEVEISCVLPPYVAGKGNDKSQVGMPNWYFAPVVKRGSKMSSGNQIFELNDDVDFSEAFNKDGYFDRTITPVRNSNNDVVNYRVSKKVMAVAGESRIWKTTIADSDVKPFMEYIIPDEDVMEIESIIVKDGKNYTLNPTLSEFMMDTESNITTNSEDPTTYRFFEVESLIEQYRWGDSLIKAGNESQPMPISYKYGYINEFEDEIVPSYSIVKGEWKPLTQKFITEYTDKGYIKIIFGSGEEIGQKPELLKKATDYTKQQISRMIRNNFLGKLPKAGTTMYVLYRKGGGASSNVAAGTINTFTFLDADIAKNANTDEERRMVTAIKNSISVTNTIPSISGKDSPTVDEVRGMLKYNNGAQERCVTLKDYQDRLLKMPSRYGCPFRTSVLEENNKVMIYLMGLDGNGKLSTSLPQLLTNNIQDYLSLYRTINDYVEIKSGRIINLSFECDIFVDKNYNSSDVVKNVITVIREYMDINRHQLGEDIYVSDIEKEVSKIDGVLNLIDMRIYNECGNGYSPTRTSQEVYTEEEGEDYNEDMDRHRINLDASDYIINGDMDTMFEIKYPNKDIKIRVKTR